MASKDERPGLLSKVAMFVRNPTKDWSELDQPEQGPEGAYDKAALKLMIERKRQNDFVRRREFDHLRKLRNRDPVALNNTARPSFFQSSMATDPDGRAVTLKKIDEIEAQMSKQWWKGKQEGQQPPTEPATLAQANIQAHDPPAPQADQTPSVPSIGSTQTYEPTMVQPLRDVQEPPSEFVATQMSEASDAADDLRPPGAPEGAALGGHAMAFSTSRLFALGGDEMAADPELEEAAIRYANGDVPGAESSLLDALRAMSASPDAAQSWLAALLDLYRATRNEDAFLRALQEFSEYLDGAQPVWFALSDLGVRTRPQGLEHSAVTWESPATLDQKAMEQLRDAMAYSAMPWTLGWQALRDIDASAVPLLDGLFGSLCDEPVELALTGVDSLVQTLRERTPAGDRSVDLGWWTVRLSVLRALGREDDFELAALDYCITHTAPPVAWQPARCKLLGPTSADRSAPTAHLQGEILGDASHVLAQLDEAPSAGTRLVVNCRHLLRVDFAAAGSILNWVAMREAEGRQVQFEHVQRLVAAFFTVIGINEHAKLIPRAL